MKGRYRFLLLGMLAALVLPRRRPLARTASQARRCSPGEGVAEEAQHGMTEGHLPPISQGVKFVGKAEVTNPAGSGERRSDRPTSPPSASSPSSRPSVSRRANAPAPT